MSYCVGTWLYLRRGLKWLVAENCLSNDDKSARYICVIYSIEIYYSINLMMFVEDRGPLLPNHKKWKLYHGMSTNNQNNLAKFWASFLKWTSNAITAKGRAPITNRLSKVTVRSIGKNTWPLHICCNGYKKAKSKYQGREIKAFHRHLSFGTVDWD